MYPSVGCCVIHRQLLLLLLLLLLFSSESRHLLPGALEGGTQEQRDTGTQGHRDGQGTHAMPYLVRQHQPGPVGSRSNLNGSPPPTVPPACGSRTRPAEGSSCPESTDKMVSAAALLQPAAPSGYALHCSIIAPKSRRPRETGEDAPPQANYKVIILCTC